MDKPKTFSYQNITLEYLGHASFKIKTADGIIIYLDPFQLQSNEPADLILISHDHYDHCDPASINLILKPDTVLIAPASAANQLKLPNLRSVSPGETLEEKGIAIAAIPAYNTNKFRSPGHPFHAKESNYVGYILNIGNTKIYHAGDTDFVPEMADLKNIDIALLPIGGTYTMTPTEASKAIQTFRPKITIPMHYNSLPSLEPINTSEFQRAASQFSQIVIL